MSFDYAWKRITMYALIIFLILGVMDLIMVGGITFNTIWATLTLTGGYLGALLDINQDMQNGRFY